MFRIFRLDEDKVLNEVSSRGSKRVLVQAPEGLRPYLKPMVDKLRELGVTVLLSGNPCYGACNLALREAEMLNVDLIVHVGHSPMVSSSRIPVVYLDAQYIVRENGCLERFKETLLRFRSLGLFSSLQFIGYLEEARKTLEEWGLKVFIGRGSGVKYPGQVLGCNYTSPLEVENRVEGFLFIGGGLFHPLGLSLLTSKPVMALNPLTCSLRDMRDLKRRYLRRRYASIVEARDGEVFGILVGLEPGQFRLGQAEGLKSLIESLGREAYLLGFNYLDASMLEAYTWIDVFVNTACPRLSLEDSERLSKPILSPAELLVALGLIRWEEYIGESSKT